MQFKFGSLLTIFILSSCYFANLNAFDLNAIGSFVSPKVLKCYKCSSLKSDDCKNITNSLNKDTMMEECAPAAQGCVKQYVQTHNGKNAIFRECYYGSISAFYKSLKCESTARDRVYDKVQCFKCRGSLCNNSDRVHFNFRIFLYTILLIIISYQLRMY